MRIRHVWLTPIHRIGRGATYSLAAKTRTWHFICTFSVWSSVGVGGGIFGPTLVLFAKLALTMGSFFSVASAQEAGTPDLSNISLDTLANTEITSVSRKGEKLSQAAAAIFGDYK